MAREGMSMSGLVQAFWCILSIGATVAAIIKIYFAAHG